MRIVAPVSATDQLDVGWILDAINECSTPTRTAAGELDDTDGNIAERLKRVEGVTSEDFVAVVDSWFEIFRAAPDPRSVCDVLNDLLIEASPTIRAAFDGSTVSSSVEFSEAVTARQRLTVGGALALLDVIAEIGLERIGLCTANHCVDVYIDRSPRRNKRYCSQLCQTRERVQRHRSHTRI